MSEPCGQEAPAGARPNAARRPKQLFRALAAGTSLLLTLAVLEIGLRLFHPVELHASDTYLVAAASRMQSGTMTLVPGARVHTKSEEFDIHVNISSQGFRDREFRRQKPPGVYRVMVIGDSQTFGQGVEAEETYSKVAERRLRARAGRPVEVINTGVPGTGTAHQLAFLEDRGWSFHPDAVVLGFFYNDIMDNGQTRLFGVRNGRAVRIAREAPQVHSIHEFNERAPAAGDFRAVHDAEPIRPPDPPFLIRHSHLARFVRQCLSNFVHGRAEQRQGTVTHKEMTARLLEAFTRECREHHVPYVIVLIPSIQQRRAGTVRTLYESYEPLLRGAIRSREEVADLWPAFERAGFGRLFFPVDTHLTAEGHRLIGEALAERLERLVTAADPAGTGEHESGKAAKGAKGEAPANDRINSRTSTSTRTITKSDGS